jgi:hypothetical protein
MTQRRLSIAAVIAALCVGVRLLAQNPVSIAQVGTTPVTSPLPVTIGVTQSATGTVDNSNQVSLTPTTGQGYAVVSITILGTSSGTVLFRVNDTGSYQPLNMLNVATNQVSTQCSCLGQSSTFIGIASGHVIFNAAGTAFGLGSDTVTITVSPVSSGMALIAPIPAGTATIGAVTFPNADPCVGNVKSYASINQTATTQILGASSGSHYYICSVDIVNGATGQNVGFIDSTTAGNACATAPAGSDGFGGTTTGSWNFAANSGISYGNGAASLGQTHNVNAALCVYQSSNGQVSGGFSYVTQ